MILAFAKSIYYSKCVNIATYPIIIIITFYYRSYFPSYSVALPRNKIKFKLKRLGSILVFFKGKSFSGLRDRPISVAAPKLWKELPNHTRSTVLTKALFRPVHTNPRRLKPVSIVYTTSPQKKHSRECFQKGFSKKNQVTRGIFHAYSTRELCITWM